MTVTEKAKTAEERALSKDVLSEEKLKSLIQTKEFGKKLLYLKSVDSTNTEGKRQGLLSAPHGLLVVADKQEQGKGRRGRSWDSDAEKIFS